MNAAAPDLLKRDQVFPFLMPKSNDQLNIDKNILLYLEGLSVSFDALKPSTISTST